MTHDFVSCDDRRPGLKPPQFGLGTMFVVVTLICSVLVAIRAAGPFGGSVLILLLLAILAHVAGNAIGCRLRANGDTRTLAAGGEESRFSRLQRRESRVHFAPATELGARRALGRWMTVLTALGAIMGAVVGGSLLAALNWERATVVNISIGAVSFATLGGLWGFWASSFLRTLFGAVAQAHRESKD